jgi:acetyl esterase/lipase
MGLEKFRNRDDVKWAHPELELAYEMMGQSVGYSEVLLNDDLPREERIEFAKHAEDGFKEFLPDYNWDYVTEYKAPGCIDEPDAPLVPVLVAEPKTGRRYKKNSPCILIIPGGGLSTCFRFTAAIEEWADKYQVPVATLTYRTVVTGKGFPEPVNDCEAAYNYLAEHAKELNISANKIILHGNSSGGHLSLALCHRLKKRGICPRGCLVWVPIIDDRPMYRSCKINSAFWGASDAATSARLYLGKLNNQTDVPPEAFPGRATVEDCVGLPPTFIHAMMNDNGLDQAFDYASKLTAAGVYCELHAWGGSQHCSLSTAANILDKDDPEAEYAQLFNKVNDKEFKDMFEYDLRRPWTVEEFNEKD